jgi:hypothetical protein
MWGRRLRWLAVAAPAVAPRSARAAGSLAPARDWRATGGASLRGQRSMAGRASAGVRAVEDRPRRSPGGIDPPDPAEEAGQGARRLPAVPG